MPLFLKYYNILISYFLWVFCDFNLIFLGLTKLEQRKYIVYLLMVFYRVQQSRG